MNTLKKLQVAAAVASLFAVSDAALAASISQSGVTVAREVISLVAAANQTLTAPAVSFSFNNGPTANAASTQDFSISMQLAGDGTPTWRATPLVAADIFRTVNAKRQSGNTTIPLVGPAATAPLLGATVVAYLRLIDVQLEGPTTLRYFFRLENPTVAAVSLSDLVIEFNSVNSTGTIPTITSGPTVPAAADYVRVATLQNSVTAIVGSTVGSLDGGLACGNNDTRVTVRARNFIGSGPTAPEGETQGFNVINNGYISFAQALNVQVGKVIAPNRSTDPTASNFTLTTDPLTFGSPTRMVLGAVKFSNVPALSAWDTSIDTNYYQFRGNGPGPVGDLATFGTVNGIGNVDVNSLVMTIVSTNGFAAGSTFSLTNNPFGVTGAAGIPGANSGATATSVTFSPDGLTATATFSHADLVAAANNTAALGTQTLLGSTGAAVLVTYPIPTIDRFYINYLVPGNVAIPLSSFSGTARLTKEAGSNEQANLSCLANLAGLGGGVKVDVRNFFPFNPANPNNEWVGVLRVINNDENVTADLTGQYIRADGKYGQWGSMGSLPPRGSRYFLSSEVFTLLNQNSLTPGADNTGSGGIAASAGQQLPANTRLRISSNAASTLRVQSYIYNAITRSLVEVSSSQGADFVNIEASPRDHIDQDAQTGIKK